MNVIDYFIVLIPVIFLIITLFLRVKFGFNKKTIEETVDFYLPKEFNSLEIGFIYKEKAKLFDAVSLLIYLANKGYIKIVETEKNMVSSKFKIIKLKEYDGENINEKIFLDDLDFVSNTDEITIKDLYNSFYDNTIRVILYNINNKKNKSLFFEKIGFINKFLVKLMIIVSYCLITVRPLIIHSNFTDSFLVLLVNGLGISLITGIGFMFILKALFFRSSIEYINVKTFYLTIGKRIFSVFLGIIFGIIPLYSLALPALLVNLNYFIYYIVDLVCIFFMVMCLNRLCKRTSYGNKMLKRIDNFKNFVEVNDKDKLKTLILQDSSYFYDNLPYVYVLGISDKWFKNFDGIVLKPPFWYESFNEFSVESFKKFMDDVMILLYDSVRTNSKILLLENE